MSAMTPVYQPRCAESAKGCNAPEAGVPRTVEDNLVRVADGRLAVEYSPSQGPVLERIWDSIAALRRKRALVNALPSDAVPCTLNHEVFIHAQPPLFTSRAALSRFARTLKCTRIRRMRRLRWRIGHRYVREVILPDGLDRPCVCPALALLSTVLLLRELHIHTAPTNPIIHTPVMAFLKRYGRRAR